MGPEGAAGDYGAEPKYFIDKGPDSPVERANYTAL